MHQGFAAVTDHLKGIFYWLPNWASATIIVVLICGVALYFHALTLRLIRRSRASHHKFVNLLLIRSTAPTRLAILLLALGAALPVSGITSQVQHQMIAPFSAVFILLVGWSAIAGVGLAGDLYLGRFNTGYEDPLTRKHITQARLMRRVSQVLIALIAVAVAMMTLPGIRQYGVSLFASAGAAGIVVGLAARPLLSNLLAGIQIAITQPVKIEDSVVINGEWGWVEDITSTYLVVRIWDWRRLIVPLSWFLEQPFQNWTRESSSIIGSVHLFVDYRTPVDVLRKEVQRFAQESKLWDKNVINLQVVEATAEAIQLRILATASDASRTWDLRCELREKTIAFLKERYPECLPRRRLYLSHESEPAVTELEATAPRRGQAAG